MGNIDFALCYFVLYQNQMIYRKLSIVYQQSFFYQQAFDITKNDSKFIWQDTFLLKSFGGFYQFLIALTIMPYQPFHDLA